MPLPLPDPQFDGVHAEALGIDYNSWGLWELGDRGEAGRLACGGPAWRSVEEGRCRDARRAPRSLPARPPTAAATPSCCLLPAPAPRLAAFPPALYADMVRDEKTSKKIEDNRRTLEKRGSPVEVVEVRAPAQLAQPRLVGAGRRDQADEWRGPAEACSPAGHSSIHLAPPLARGLQVTARKVYPTYFSERFPSEVSPGAPRCAACLLACTAGRAGVCAQRSGGRGLPAARRCQPARMRGGVSADGRAHRPPAARPLRLQS